MLPPFRAGVAGVLASGRQWMSWIHIDDLTALITTALTDACFSGVINGTAPEPVTNKAFTAALAEAVSMPALIPTPGFALRALFGELADELLASHRVLPRKAQALGFPFRFKTVDEALKDVVSPSGEHLFIARQFIAKPLKEVFPFFSDAMNLEKLTPPWLSFTVLGKPGAVHEGMLIDYKLKVHGLPVRWQTRIESYAPPHRFVDTQLRGPYALWHHTHLFHEVAGGTLMEDYVRYRLPLGVAGGAVDSAGDGDARGVELPADRHLGGGALAVREL
jgi:ligand-binding SRPBCC domain-containing protein